MVSAEKAVCVIGWPVAHSRSPLIHHYWIKKLGLNAEYRREAVPPEAFASFVRELAARGYIGANVTVPHKEAVLSLAEPDERARIVGAANALWLEDGRLRATNTDVEGFLASLDAAVPGWHAGLGSALVLGAGGAARAIVAALVERDVRQIVLANRSIERAIALAARFGSAITAIAWSELPRALGRPGLLVNTTSLGMSGQPELDIDVERLPARAIVADIVYAPLETGLLRAARARGLRTVDGLGMLLHQAVGGFERWFGVRPAVTPELRALVEADLARS